ncbi:MULTISPECIES: hypothetical protein [Novacetimonas]|nr:MULTISPECIES: hypothetical protein [Novacetimonas]
MTMGTRYHSPGKPGNRSDRNTMDLLGIGIIVLTLALWIALTLI